MRKFTKDECRNLQDLTAMLRMFKSQKVIGHHFTPDYKILFIHFEDFVLEIDVEKASWKLGEMSVFVSPIVERIPWDG